ncbi:amidohydrolase [Minicystis rosea]|nr:amidohydrolase [Minicystis rosea]
MDLAQPAPARRRRLRFALGVLGALLFVMAGIAVHLRLALGPELKTAPLVTASPAPTALFFHDVAVFTGTGPVSQPHCDVLVQGGRVVSIKPTGAAPPAGAEIVEGAGRTLLPGLIDAHTHVSGSGAPPWAQARLTDAHNLEAYVYAGVTTTYVLGGIAGDLAKLEREATDGKLIGPHLWYTHLPITAPGGHPTVVGKQLVPWPLSSILASLIPQPETAAAAEAAVAETEKQGAHFIKAMIDKLPPSAPEMREEILRAIAEAAHKRQKKLFVHIGTTDDALASVRAGADVLAHGVYRGTITKAQAEEIARAKVPVIFTMAGWVRTAALGHGTWKPSALDEATVPREILASLGGDAGKSFAKGGALAEFVAALLENERFWFGNARTLHEAGVTMLVGTDSPLPGIFPGSSLHEEMRLLVEAGIPPGEVLLGATSRAADVLALDVGRLEEGRPAELVLVRGDPVADIRAAVAVDMVVLRGRVVRRAR